MEDKNRANSKSTIPYFDEKCTNRILRFKESFREKKIATKGVNIKGIKHQIRDIGIEDAEGIVKSRNRNVRVMIPARIKNFFIKLETEQCSNLRVGIRKVTPKNTNKKSEHNLDNKRKQERVTDVICECQRITGR
jgi:hypothetical protein